MNPAFALVEVLWIAAGRADTELPAFWNRRLTAFCGNEPELEGAYGHRLRREFGIDQLDRVYQALESIPDSRQAVLSIWSAAADLPHPDGTPSRSDIPCNVAAFPKIRNGRLEWMQILRSNDLFLGTPHNIVQFTALQEILAGWLGVQLGSYNQLSDSLHVYARDHDNVLTSLVPVAAPKSTDSFALDRPSWERVFPSVIGRLERMTRPELRPDELRALALAGDAPEAYEHALRVAAADAARRRGWSAISEVCIAAVRNPLYLALWNRWLGRVAKPSPKADQGDHSCSAKAPRALSKAR
jgi:thymidylate synthase